MRDESKVEFLILRHDYLSKVYKFEPPVDFSWVIDLITEPINIQELEFPDESGNSISAEVAIVEDYIPSIKFIMSVRQNKFRTWEFQTKWNSPVLQIKNSIIDFGWQQATTDKLVNRLANMAVEYQISEEVVSDFLKLLKTGLPLGENIINEILMATTAAISGARNTLGSYLYIDLASAMGVPSEHSFPWGEDELHGSREVGLQVIRERWEVHDLIHLFTDVLQLCKDRTIDINSFNDIGEIFFKYTRFKLHWLERSSAYRLKRLLEDKSISVEEIHERMNYSEKYSHCFISFSHLDIDFAKKLHEDLEKNKVNCWFAPKDAKGGEKLHHQIKKAIETKDKVILILSEASMESEWVKTEISNARKRELTENTNLLFPIRLVDFQKIQEWENFDADTGKDTAKEIREYLIIDFSEWRNDQSYRKNFRKLLNDLEKR